MTKRPLGKYLHKKYKKLTLADSREPPPEGFVNCYDESNHAYLQCNHFKNDIQCDFYIAKYHLQKVPTVDPEAYPLKHQHYFGQPTLYDVTRRTDVQNQNQDDHQDQTQQNQGQQGQNPQIDPDVKAYFEDLKDCDKSIKDLNTMELAIMYLFASRSLPMDLVDDQLFRNVLIMAMHLGRKHIGTSNMSAVLDSHLPRRTSFQERFICVAKMHKDLWLKEFKKEESVGVAIDAGKLGKRSYLTSSIMCATSQLKPMPLETFPNFTGTKVAYEHALSHITDFLKRFYQIDVAGFVADNLRVQWSALASVLENAPEHLAIPCGCHTFHLCLNDARKLCPKFDKFCQNVELFSKIFSSKPVASRLGGGCPTVCLTRWTNLYDIASWIVFHVESIVDFLVSADVREVPEIHEHIEGIVKVLFVYAPSLVSFLTAFKLLSQKLESDNIMIAQVFPYTLSALISTQEVMHQDLQPFYDILKTQMDQRMYQTKHGYIQYALFVFTYIGREFHRMKNSQKREALELIKTKYNLMHCEQDCLKKANAILNHQKIKNLTSAELKRKFTDVISKTTGVPHYNQSSFAKINVYSLAVNDNNLAGQSSSNTSLAGQSSSNESLAGQSARNDGLADQAANLYAIKAIVLKMILTSQIMLMSIMKQRDSLLQKQKLCQSLQFSTPAQILFKQK